MTTDFDPDAALDQMTAFLTGLRTIAGYGEFARTTQALGSHLHRGGRLPQRWWWAGTGIDVPGPFEDISDPGSMAALRSLADEYGSRHAPPVLRAAAAELARWAFRHQCQSPAGLEARVVVLETLAREMLGRFTKTDDGHRARVGQVQIARWQGVIDGPAGG